MNVIVPTQMGLNRQIANMRQAGGTGDGAFGQYLTLLVGADLCAIGVLAIKEIIEYGGVTVVPMMPSFVRGIINLRGSVVPVMDLQARFGRGQAMIGRKSCIVIVEVETRDQDDESGQPQVFGLVVDAVNAVLEIGAADIEPAPSFGTCVRTDFIAGMGRLKGKQEGTFVVLLDLPAVLAMEELAAPPGLAPALAMAN